MRFIVILIFFNKFSILLLIFVELYGKMFSLVILGEARNLVKSKLLIGSNFFEESDKLLNYLSQKNIEHKLCAKNGHLICEEIKRENPHFVIIDMFMPGLDAIGIMRRTREEAKTFPVFAVCSSYTTPLLERELISEGASVFAVGPIEFVDVIEKTLMHVVSTNGVQKMSDEDAVLYAKITTYLQRLGVPSHIKGFQYLRDGVLLVHRNPNIINHMTRMLYPRIGQMYNVTGTRVERSVRGAIELTWERGDKAMLRDCFSENVNFGKGRPTNGEFIAVVADKVRMSRFPSTRKTRLIHMD